MVLMNSHTIAITSYGQSKLSKQYNATKVYPEKTDQYSASLSITLNPETFVKVVGDVVHILLFSGLRCVGCGFGVFSCTIPVLGQVLVKVL